MNPSFRYLAHWIRESRNFPKNLLLRTMAGAARETTCLRYCEGKAPGVTLVRPLADDLTPDNSNPPKFRIDGEWSGEKNDVEVFVQFAPNNDVGIWTLSPLHRLYYPEVHNPWAEEDIPLNLLKFNFSLNGAIFNGTLSIIVPPLGPHLQDGVVLTRTYPSGISSTTHVT